MMSAANMRLWMLLRIRCRKAGEGVSRIREDIEEREVDGVRMIFQNTPGTEAPAEMNTYFPDMKAFWAAENIVATVHNIYTLRGAEVMPSCEEVMKARGQ